MFLSTKLKGVGVLMSSVLTSDIEMRRLKFVQMVFELTLVQYFLTMTPSLHFELYILCYGMLEVCVLCVLLFYFDFIGDYS